MKAPATYYQQLKENLKKSKVKIVEDLDMVSQKMFIYSDFKTLFKQTYL